MAYYASPHSGALRNQLGDPRLELLPGIYVPTPCFFTEDDEVDTATITKHTIRLAHSGIRGITVQGSNGEAVHLSREERNLVTRTTRSALDSSSFSSLPIIVGCGAQSTREAIELCADAAASGGDYALILPPSYYKYSRDALLEHFTSIADRSPLPLIIYNYPAAAAGTDLDSDFLIELAEHPNVIGVKLTCGNVGKLARVATGTDTMHGTCVTGTFLTLAGSADFLLGALAAGGSGALAGLANICPKACVALCRAYDEGDHAQATSLQRCLAKADEVVQKGGIVGTKAALEGYLGYGGYARKPLGRMGKEEARKNMEGFAEVMDLEKRLF